MGVPVTSSKKDFTFNVSDSRLKQLDIVLVHKAPLLSDITVSPSTKSEILRGTQFPSNTKASEVKHSSMITIFLSPRVGKYETDFIKSLIPCTEFSEAASISITSGYDPAIISLQESHSLQGSPSEDGFSQHIAFA